MLTLQLLCREVIDSLFNPGNHDFCLRPAVRSLLLFVRPIRDRNDQLCPPPIGEARRLRSTRRRSLHHRIGLPVAEGVEALQRLLSLIFGAVWYRLPPFCADRWAFCAAWAGFWRSRATVAEPSFRLGLPSRRRPRSPCPGSEMQHNAACKLMADADVLGVGACRCTLERREFDIRPATVKQNRLDLDPVPFAE